jgi:hypothetical protein
MKIINFFRKRNDHRNRIKRVSSAPPAYEVKLKDGVEATPENLAAAKELQDQIDLRFEQHQKNKLVLQIVQDVADGKIDDDEAKNRLALLTDEANVVDFKDLNGKTLKKLKIDRKAAVDKTKGEE